MTAYLSWCYRQRQIRTFLHTSSNLVLGQMIARDLYVRQPDGLAPDDKAVLEWQLISRWSAEQERHQSQSGCKRVE
eukprot:COSAG02_NODE_10679_length_1884_cov_47.049860_2_plen_76_part_00